MEDMGDIAIRLLASLFCALVLGLERKTRQHTVGLRTLILIGLSCTLLCVLSTYLVGMSNAGDPTRVAAGVVTGVGFLGGGAIMRQGLNIRGLTSAAVIWTVAALGLACGAALYFPAAIVLAVSLIALIALEHTEGHYSTEMTKTVRVTYLYEKTNDDDALPGGENCHDAVQKVLESMGYIVRDVNAFCGKDGGFTVEYSVKVPPKSDTLKLMHSILKMGAVEAGISC